MNNTFIDWYSETTLISHSSVSFTYKKWLVIVITAVVSGYAVTIIDLISVWLNDLRKGICLSDLDKWSLLNPYSSCPAGAWNNWSEILVNSDRVVASTLVNFPIFVITGSVCAALAIYVSQTEPSIQQSGIPEVKSIIQGFNYNLDKYLGLRTLFLEIVGLSLVSASGFWLGKEGPFVHVACCILNVMYNLILGKLQGTEAVRRELLSAATATGISLAFNSPIGGVLFVLECIPSYFFPTKIMWNSFVSAAIGLVVLVGFRSFTEGINFNEEDLFSVEFGGFSWLILELIPFIGLGVIGGFYGWVFISIYTWTMKSRASIQQRLCTIFRVPIEKANYLEILLIFFVTCILNFPIAMSRLQLDAFLKSLFINCPEPGESNEQNSASLMCSSSNVVTSIKLLYIAVQALFLSAYSFGTILPGGVLMPSLVIGAVSGRFVGIMSKGIQSLLFGSSDTCTQNSCLVSPASYAVIGAGAFMTGVTKLTMCVVVILFELSGALSYVLPIMVAVMVSKFVSDYLCSENIYDALLTHGFNKSKIVTGDVMYNVGKGSGLFQFSNSTAFIKAKLPEVTVSKVMIPVKNTKCIYLVSDEAMTLNQLHAFLIENTHEGFPLLASPTNPISLGYIHKQDIYTSLSHIDSANGEDIISFQVSGVPTEVLSHQIRHEQGVDPNTLIKLELEPEKPFIIMNDKTWLSLVIDVFEKMYLNYLIIVDSGNHTPRLMTGFIDRFIIAKLVEEQFASIRDEPMLDEEYMQQFDIEAEDSIEGANQSLLFHRERESIELIT
ncbi:chloride channel [Yamadazyma tenuis]|nr:chloride channel [Yamadazyma tenuis]